jgi:hypothetical protein
MNNDKIWTGTMHGSYNIKCDVIDWLNEQASQCSSGLIHKYASTKKKVWACNWLYVNLEDAAMFHFNDESVALLFKLTWI